MNAQELDDFVYLCPATSLDWPLLDRRVGHKDFEPIIHNQRVVDTHDPLWDQPWETAYDSDQPPKEVFQSSNIIPEALLDEEQASE